MALYKIIGPRMLLFYVSIMLLSFAIHGDKIIYNYFMTDEGSIDIYDLSTQQTTMFFLSGSSPDIYGDRIVWVENP